jgi:hypothetical protein
MTQVERVWTDYGLAGSVQVKDTVQLTTLPTVNQVCMVRQCYIDLRSKR